MILCLFSDLTSQNTMATVKLGNDVRTIQVRLNLNDNDTFRNLHVDGLGVKMGHGSKVWYGGGVVWMKDGKLGPITQVRPLNYETRRMAQPHYSVVGFYEDFKNKSQHSGQ
jgi:hypothetical protein